jgi:hypothetical protein
MIPLLQGIGRENRGEGRGKREEGEKGGGGKGGGGKGRRGISFSRYKKRTGVF